MTTIDYLVNFSAYDSSFDGLDSSAPQAQLLIGDGDDAEMLSNNNYKLISCYAMDGFTLTCLNTPG